MPDAGPIDSIRFSAEFADVAPALSAWAYLRVRGPLRQKLDPDDLVQEIAMRACLRAADFDPSKGSFRRWIFGFASRVWLEALRGLAKDPLGARRREGGDSRLPGIADSITAISQRIATDESLQATVRRLELLPEEDRGLLVCIGLEGLSHSDAGAVLGIAEDASRKRWQRLRERLLADGDLQRLRVG